MIEMLVPASLLRSYCNQYDVEHGWLPWLVNELNACLPLLETTQPRRGTYFFRLPGHRRSFFLTFNGANCPGAELVVVFKGSEAASRSLPKLLLGLAGERHPQSSTS